MTKSRGILLPLLAILLFSSAPRAEGDEVLARLLALGRKLELRFEPRRAEAVYEEALRRGPTSLDAILAMARVLETVNDVPAAHAFYAQAARLDPDSPRPAAGMGWIAVKLDRRREARISFGEALSKDDHHAPALAGLAFVAIEDGDFEGADDLLARAEEVDPESESVLAARSEWLYRRGDITGSTRLLRRLRAKNPDHLGALQRLASGYLEADRAPYSPPAVPESHDLAVRQAAARYHALRFEEIDEILAPHDTADAPDGRPAFYRGLTALRAGNPRRALKHLRRAVEREPDHPRFLNAYCAAARRLIDAQCAEYGGGRDRENRLGAIAAALPVPEIAGAHGIVRDLDRLLPAERAAALRAIAPARERLRAMRRAGATHDLVDFDEGVAERPARRYLRGRRTADGRYYPDLRGVGGLNAATGIEMLIDSAELRFDTFAHEFGHQFHYQGLTAIERDVVTKLHLSARAADRCLDYYAASNEGEYFAQGYEAFVSPAKSPWRHALRRHTRAELALRDPPLFRFLLRVTGAPEPDPALAPLAPRILAFYRWSGDGPSLAVAEAYFNSFLPAPATSGVR
ncbi:MAG: tetratricopeptide repeat protein, partial [Planctomycetes bacterium]|jgi:Tfp pilus assembly protein PilF|nr:tetratricopeptide repeat protein [Planctomycetota bacterium]MCU0728095.1 tetratricopeptide repeat protein [Planctomycetota bacterium]